MPRWVWIKCQAELNLWLKADFFSVLPNEIVIYIVTSCLANAREMGKHSKF